MLVNHSIKVGNNWGISNEKVDELRIWEWLEFFCQSERSRGRL